MEAGLATKQGSGPCAREPRANERGTFRAATRKGVVLSPQQSRAQHSMARHDKEHMQPTESTPPRGSRMTTALPLGVPSDPAWMCAMVSP